MDKKIVIRLKGRAYKDPDSSWWVSEVPCLDIETQGQDLELSVYMAADAIESLVDENLDLKLNYEFDLDTGNFVLETSGRDEDNFKMSKFIEERFVNDTIYISVDDK